MPTPESYVKKRVSALLKRHRVYYFMPVQTGFGATTLDYLGCAGGAFFSVETKKPGGKPTPRQLLTIAEIERAGGRAFVVAGDDGMAELEAFLDEHAPIAPATQAPHHVQTHKCALDDAAERDRRNGRRPESGDHQP